MGRYILVNTRNDCVDRREFFDFFDRNLYRIDFLKISYEDFPDFIEVDYSSVNNNHLDAFFAKRSKKIKVLSKDDGIILADALFSLSNMSRNYENRIVEYLCDLIENG